MVISPQHHVFIFEPKFWEWK